MKYVALFAEDKEFDWLIFEAETDTKAIEIARLHESHVERFVWMNELNDNGTYKRSVPCELGVG